MTVQGYDISALPRISSNFDLAQTVLFKAGSADSEKSGLDLIRDWIKNEFTDAIGVKDAAFCQSSDFAPAGHEHSKYTSAYYEPPSGGDDMEVFAHVHISAAGEAQQAEMRCKKHAGPVKYTVKSDIGALKFMACPDIKPKEISDPEFDGWIFPGQTVYCAKDEFKSACLVYAGDESATEFTVPPLSDFIKLSYDLTNRDLCRHVDFCRDYPAHSHTGNIHGILSVRYDPDKNKDFRLYTANEHYSEDGYMPAITAINDIKKDFNSHVMLKQKIQPAAIHAGHPKTSYNTSAGQVSYGTGSLGWLSLSATTTQVISIPNITITKNDGRQGNANVPSHNLVPILVYIGMPDD